MPETARAAGFPRSFRLLQSAVFQRVFDGQSLKSVDAYFTVLAVANELGDARLGLVIARKRIRQAVARNRVKRLTRESFRQQHPALPALDIVVLARDQTALADNRKLLVSLDQHWQRLIRLCAKSSSA